VSYSFSPSLTLETDRISLFNEQYSHQEIGQRMINVIISYATLIYLIKYDNLLSNNIRNINLYLEILVCYLIILMISK
jgi:hypothetical protein